MVKDETKEGKSLKLPNFLAELFRQQKLVMFSALGPFLSASKRLVWSITNVGRTIALNARWLVLSREHTNYTYSLSSLNRLYMENWVSQITNVPLEEVRGYFAELDQDEWLKTFYRNQLSQSRKSAFADMELKFGRRLAWYAFVRIFKPSIIVETGTDKGLGALVLWRAVKKNSFGTVHTVDTNPESGFLLNGIEDEALERHFVSSIEWLMSMQTRVDLLIHDSLHTPEYESAEFTTAAPLMSEGGIIMSDNSHGTSALFDFSRDQNREFFFFQEVPDSHPYPGGGIGLSIATR